MQDANDNGLKNFTLTMVARPALGKGAVGRVRRCNVLAAAGNAGRVFQNWTAEHYFRRIYP